MLLMMMGWRSIAGASAGRVRALAEEFPNQVEGIHSESNLSKEDSLDSNEGDDTEEERNEGSEFQFQEEKNGEELLDLLLLLATSCKKRDGMVSL